MTTTDHAIVAPAVTGDPGTRADAGGFDPGRPFRTRDGRKVKGFGRAFGGGYFGKVKLVPHCRWRPDGTCVYQDEDLDLVNVDPVDPAAPDPIPQPEGDAPPAPAQSAGAAAEGEDDAWEYFEDSSYYDMWAVRQKGERSFNRTLHLVNEDEAKWLAEHLTALARCGARPHEPADASARSAARAWLHTYGIKTERYTSGGGDHPAMDTLPAAFEAFASARSARGEVAEAVLAEREACAQMARDKAAVHGILHSKTDSVADLAVAGACDALSVAILARPTVVPSCHVRSGQNGEKPNLFDQLHIENMTREWFAGPNATVENYLPILKLRLARARPTPAAVLDRARPAGQSEGEPAAWQWRNSREDFWHFAAKEDRAAWEASLYKFGEYRALYAAPPSAAAAPPAPASRVTSAPAQDAGPAGVTEEMVEIALAVWRERSLITDDDVAMSEALEAAARARTPDAGKEPGR